MRTVLPHPMVRRLRVTAAAYALAFAGLFPFLAVDAQQTPSQISAPLTRQAPWVGAIEARDVHTIVAPHAGRVLGVAFAEDARVASGEVLLHMEAPDAAASVRLAQRAMVEAEQNFMTADAAVARAVRMTRREPVSLEAVAERRTRAAAARLRLIAARQALRDARHDPAVTIVRAPVAGAIHRSKARLNQNVAAGAELLTIVGDEVNVVFEMPRSAAPLSRRVRFSLPESERVFTGEFQYLDASTTSPRRRARLQLDGDAALVPGRSGLVALEPAPTPAQPALALADGH